MFLGGNRHESWLVSSSKDYVMGIVAHIMNAFLYLPVLIVVE
jgi:hypothetical protein